MFEDSFIQIEHGKAAQILDLLNPKLDGSPFDPAMARIMGHSMPFYKGYSLIEVSDHDVTPPRRVACLKHDEQNEIYILNGTNEPIYELNHKVPVFLDSENVKLYVRFFFTYVRGRHGRFHIVENTDEISWREEPAPNARKALGKMIMPLDANMDEDGFTLRASIVFKDSLFESDISVARDGSVTISNQELLVEDIPVIDDSFAQ